MLSYSGSSRHSLLNSSLSVSSALPLCHSLPLSSTRTNRGLQKSQVQATRVQKPKLKNSDKIEKWQQKILSDAFATLTSVCFD